MLFLLHTILNNKLKQVRPSEQRTQKTHKAEKGKKKKLGGQRHYQMLCVPNWKIAEF